MTKTFRELIQYLQDFGMFWIWYLCHSYLFRISDFELRIFGKLNKQISFIHSTCYRFKWFIPERLAWLRSLYFTASLLTTRLTTRAQKIFHSHNNHDIPVYAKSEGVYILVCRHNVTHGCAWPGKCVRWICPAFYEGGVFPYGLYSHLPGPVFYICRSAFVHDSSEQTPDL